MSFSSCYNSGSHEDRSTAHLEDQDDLVAGSILRPLVDLAGQAMNGPQTMLAINDSRGIWHWIGGEHLNVSDVCRDRLIAGIQGHDVPPDGDERGNRDPDIIDDTLIQGQDLPRLRWVAARIQHRGALIACDVEPWEPDERIPDILAGFARLIGQELQRQEEQAGILAPQSRDTFKDLIVDSARDGVLGLDRDGRCRFVNETAALLMRREAESVLDTSVADLFEFPDSASADSLFGFQDGDPVEISDAVLPRPDGDPLPVEITILPNVESSGVVIGAVLRFSDLTDRMAAADAARQNEARHQAFLDMTLDSIVTIDADQQILEFNRAAEQTFRCAAEDVAGRDFSATLVPRPWREWFRSAFRTYATTGGGPLDGQRVQMDAMRPDGSQFPVEITITGIPSRHDWVYTLYIQNLTAQRWVERRRNTRYEVTRILAENQPLDEALPVVLERICTGLEWDWAAFWSREPGSSRMRIELTWQGESVEAAPLEIASRQESFEPDHGLLGQVWTNRESHWVEDLSKPGPYLRSEAAVSSGFRSMAALPVIGRREVIGVIEFHSRNTRELDPETLRTMDSLGSQIGQYIERKQIEEERVQILSREQLARAEAEIAERRLSFLAEASAQLSASLDYEVTLANVARLAVPKLGDYCAIDMLHENGEVRSLEIADVDPEKEEIGRQVQAAYPVDPESDNPVAQVLRTAHPILYPEVTDDILRLFSEDNDSYFRILKELGVDSAMYVPLIARGRTFGVISFVASESGHQYGPSDLALAQELTRRAALAIDNARLYREAQEAVRVREEFLSIASHELKTPLTTVKGYSQILSRLLRRPNVDQERLIHLADQLQDQLGRFETLIADLLDISRIQQGGLELRPEPTDMVELARSVMSRFSYPSEPTASHQFVLDGPDSVQGIWDPDRLDQVLTNLISNAVKYSPDGGDITVKIEHQEDDTVVVTVSDQGIGIPEEEQPQLFRPFARSETVQRAISGVGLGLYISRQIVDRHGGMVWLESQPGEGSTFGVLLPREYPGVSGEVAGSQPGDTEPNE